LPRERPAVEAGLRLKLPAFDPARRDRAQYRGGAADGVGVNRQALRWIADCGLQRIGKCRDDLDQPQIVERVVEVVERQMRGSAQPHLVGHRVVHERQRAIAECLAYERRRDIEDAIAETCGEPGAAVVQFVRMQYEDLARRRVPRLAAIVEALHTGDGVADRVGVVPVRGVGAAAEARLEALKAGGWPGSADPASSGGAARSFKTDMGRRCLVLAHGDPLTVIWGSCR
jgi:hypothetical protein